MYIQGWRVMFHISDVTVDGTEAWKSDSSLPPEVTLGPCVDPLDQALLIQEGMVGTQCTGSIIVTLMIVAQVRLPHGGNVLVHMHLLAQCHHQEDACKCNRESDKKREVEIFIFENISCQL